MDIFVEPVTEDQVQKIQSKNAAKVEAFERKVLGLHGGVPPVEENEQNEKGKWAIINASIPEALAEEEKSVLESNGAEEALLEVAGEMESYLNEADSAASSILRRENTKNQNQNVLVASSGADDDHVDNKDQPEEKENEEKNAGKSAEDVAIEDSGHDADTEEGRQMEEGTIVGEEPAAGDEASVPKSQQSPSGEDPISSDVNDSNSGGPEHPRQPESIEAEAIDSAEKPVNIPADSPFLNRTGLEGFPTEPGEILAITLNIRNKKNGHYVHRPETLKAGDSWTVQYSLAEIFNTTQAWARYTACQNRRQRQLEAMNSAKDGAANVYIQQLRDLSRRGAEWQEEKDKRDQARPRYVVGQPLPWGEGEQKGEGEGGGSGDPKPQ